MEWEYAEGATPLDRTEIEALRLSHITSRAELDRWEQENIQAAQEWAFTRRRKEILTEKFCLDLHKRMFNRVWRWAGRYRTSDKNIGVPHWDIAMKVRHLCDDTQQWIAHSSYPEVEMATRFHHRLVSIHAFANGNGRHARLMTDLLLVFLLDQPRFSWGSGNLTHPGQCRIQYLTALREADNRDFTSLLKFVRT